MGCSTDSLWTVTNNRLIRVATKRELGCLGTSLFTSHFFSITARVPEGADGSGGPGAAPIAAPISQRSRKPPARGRRLIQPPDLLPEIPGGSQPGEYTAASCTTGR
jgi:hypothetical protein